MWILGGVLINAVGRVWKLGVESLRKAHSCCYSSPKSACRLPPGPSFHGSASYQGMNEACLAGLFGERPKPYRFGRTESNTCDPDSSHSQEDMELSGLQPCSFVGKLGCAPVLNQSTWDSLSHAMAMICCFRR